MTEILTKIYFNFKNSIDLSKQTRQDWQNVAYGTDRVVAQQLLIKLSNVAEDCGSEKDSIDMLKAAHAVLPLQGVLLDKLIDGLLQEHPLPLEWTDALMANLKITRIGLNEKSGNILVSLKESINAVCCNVKSNKLSISDRIRINNIIGDLRRFGYGGVTWLKEFEDILNYNDDKKIINKDDNMIC